MSKEKEKNLYRLSFKKWTRRNQVRNSCLHVSISIDETFDYPKVDGAPVYIKYLPATFTQVFECRNRKNTPEPESVQMIV